MQGIGDLFNQRDGFSQSQRYYSQLAQSDQFTQLARSSNPYYEEMNRRLSSHFFSDETLEKYRKEAEYERIAREMREKYLRPFKFDVEIRKRSPLQMWLVNKMYNLGLWIVKITS